MISYADALNIINGLKPTLSLERLTLGQCVGRALAEDLMAKVPSPPYTNSAMDGFAVRHEELVVGKAFAIAGAIMAGPVRSGSQVAVQPGSCVKIMTGAPLPEWADTVIPVENAEVSGDTVRFQRVPEHGANVRLRGSDLAEGTLVLKSGVVMDPERIMVAAAFGYREVSVRERPHLMFFSTGDELVEPGEPLPHGAIYNSSKYFLMAAAAQLGFGKAPHVTLADDPVLAAKTIAEAIDTRKPAILITTGAVSAGDADFIPKIGAELGFKALFHKVAIRPGKPVYLAVKDHVVWLGLPGNPISTSVGWHVFARPLLAALASVPAAEKRTLILKNEVRKPENIRCFFRAEVNGNRAWVAQRQGSAQFAASITSEAYVELPEGFSRIPAETRVEAIIL